MSNSQFEQLQAQDTVYALARAGERCYAARASGLYRSDDEGHHWLPAYERLDVEIDPPVVTTAVVACGQAVFAGVKGAILRSSNGGTDWFTAVLPPPAPLISVLAVSPNYEQDGVLIAGTAEDGVFVSTDRGHRWMPWNFGLLDLNVYAAVFSPHFADDQTIIIGTESGIFRSRNGGRAWRALPFPMDAAPVLSLGYAGDSARLLAGTEAHGLYVSDDQGTTWRPVMLQGDPSPVNAIMHASGGLWALQDDALLRSDDEGQTWQVVSASFPADVSAVALLPGHGPQASILAGFADGVLRRLPQS